ncbi:MAG: PsbP-related protein [Candidatus Nitrosocosmicus sp.]
MAVYSVKPLNLVYAQDTNSSLSTYQNSTYGITIKYPHNWSIIGSAGVQDTDIDIVTFLSPVQDDNVIVEVHQDKQGNSTKDIGAYLSSLSSLYKNNIKDFNVIESDTNSYLAGKAAYKLVFTYTTGDGFRMKDMEIGTLIGNKVYYIIYDGRESVFDNYTPVVQSMADTFKVTPTK